MFLPIQRIAATHSANFSSGEWSFNVSLCRSLSSRATESGLARLCIDRSVPLGKYCRSSRLVFSLVPRCRGLWGSQKQTSRSASSLPRSRVSDPRKFTRQVLNLPDERGYDAVGVLVGDLGEEHVTGLTLDQRCDVTVARAGNRIPLPVAGDGEVPCGGRTFADRACCAQTGRQFLLQNAPGLPRVRMNRPR